MNKKAKIVKKKHRKARLRIKAKKRELLKNKAPVKSTKTVKEVPEKKTIIFKSSKEWKKKTK